MFHQHLHGACKSASEFIPQILPPRTSPSSASLAVRRLCVHSARDYPRGATAVLPAFMSRRRLCLFILVEKLNMINMYCKTVEEKTLAVGRHLAIEPGSCIFRVRMLGSARCSLEPLRISGATAKIINKNVCWKNGELLWWHLTVMGYAWVICCTFCY